MHDANAMSRYRFLPAGAALLYTSSSPSLLSTAPALKPLKPIKRDIGQMMQVKEKGDPANLFCVEQRIPSA